MAKFSEIAKGTLARRQVELELPGGASVRLAVVPLVGGTEAEILRDARAFAKEYGLENPKDGDPLYALGVQVHTIARACVDPTSPEAAPSPFFDGGVKQILDPVHGLTRQQIAILFEAQSAWQDELAPGPKDLGPAAYLAMLFQAKEAPEPAELPFFRWRRAQQADLIAFMANLLFSSPQSKSPGGPSSQATSPSTSSSASSPSPTISSAPPAGEKELAGDA